MNWDSPEERLELLERVGHVRYNEMLRARHRALPSIHPVQTRFGTLWAVKGTNMAYRTREEAEKASKEKGGSAEQ